MRGWYRAANVILSTSWREGSGYSLVEAISEGCVPVATSIPSHRAIVGDLAPTFSPGDPLAAAALLVAAPPINAGSVRDFAQRNLCWPKVADQLVIAYKSACHSRR
jgi:glycosyltransferase involved in cell wall biosynthesis